MYGTRIPHTVAILKDDAEVSSKILQKYQKTFLCLYRTCHCRPTCYHGFNFFLYLLEGGSPSTAERRKKMRKLVTLETVPLETRRGSGAAGPRERDWAGVEEHKGEQEDFNLCEDCADKHGGRGGSEDNSRKNVMVYWIRYMEKLLFVYIPIYIYIYI